MQDNGKGLSSGQDSGSAESATSPEKTASSRQIGATRNPRAIPFGAGIFEKPAPKPDQDRPVEEVTPTPAPVEPDGSDKPAQPVNSSLRDEASRDDAVEPSASEGHERDAKKEETGGEAPLADDVKGEQVEEEDESEDDVEKAMQQYMVDVSDDEADEDGFDKIPPGPTEEVNFGRDYRRRRSPRTRPRGRKKEPVRPSRDRGQKKQPVKVSRKPVLIAILVVAAIVLLGIVAILVF